MDGLDVALLDMQADSKMQIKAATTVALPAQLRTQLLQLALTGNDDIDTLGYADVTLGAFIGHTINNFIASHSIRRQDIVAIGSHGQTVRHRPPTEKTAGFTLQIGDANQIAEITGITTVADFRRRDMAAGGQGAPLVPPFHQAIFAAVGTLPVILNIGGISNISILGKPTRGFDTGPGNCLLDSWCEEHKHLPYDKGGEWAKQGQVDNHLLHTLLQDPYFASPPPKSTGREYFNLAWLKHHLNSQTPNDVQATLCELTARCTVDTLAQLSVEYSHLIVCGGGRCNDYLMQRLADLSPTQTDVCEAFGVDGDSLEAAAFAWLAQRTLSGKSGNAPAVTGATHERILGAIYPK